MKPVYLRKSNSTVPMWTNPELRLYHGTLRKHVKSIESGINLAKCDDGTDFGLGFYTTTSRSQAISFATSKVGYEGNSAAVIEFTVNRDALAALDSLWFVRSARNADEFWALVTACRKNGETNRGEQDWYDIVIGPVARRFQKRTYWPQYDQISFHTPNAVRLLDNSAKEVTLIR